MKTIYFVRHAKSSWDDPTLSDHDRPLNKRGKRDAPFMAEVLRRTGAKVDGIVSSTAKRARNTAKHFASEFGLAAEQVTLEARLYHAYEREITAVIHQLPADWETVLIFGHNPGFTDLANTLAGSYLDNVPTCGIFGAEADVKKWTDWRAETATRHRYYYPKQFQ